MTETASHRQILRSTSIIGGSTVISVVIGLVRTKAAALVLGPEGVGMIGLMRNLMSTASTACAVGVSATGTRQIAEASSIEDESAVPVAWRAVWLGSLALAIAGAAIFFCLSPWLGKGVLGAADSVTDARWLSLGVLATVAAGAPIAYLNGLRHVGDVARVTVLSALVSTLVSIGALLAWGGGSELAFVLSLPASSLLVGWVYVMRVPRRAVARRLRWAELSPHWRALARVGVGVMAGGVISTLGELVIRARVVNQIGEGALGQFQAAWSISMTYIGYVLAAMATDYYPRLTTAIGDSLLANRLVNEQTEVSLLLAGPLFVAMLGLAPWIIELLYSSRFTGAVAILRWQVLGDVLKVASFPLAYSILASGAGGMYLLTQGAFSGILATVVWIWLPSAGLGVTGVGFAIAYAIYLTLVYGVARRRTGLRWTSRVWLVFAVVCLFAVTVHLLAALGPVASGVGGVAGALLLGSYSFRRLVALSSGGAATGGRLSGMVSRLGRSRAH